MVNPSKVLPQTSHGVEHHLETRGPPIASPFRRLDAEKLAAAKVEFAVLERDKIIRQSSSPWASPLHMVKKPDGSWQCCSNYLRLNNVTVPDTYPLPNMMDFSSRVAGCSIFTKIDLRKGYYQIPMHPADILKTAIIMPFGLSEFLRLTFRLRNAGSTFQRLMDRVLAGLAFAFVYLDDIIIASPSMEQHQQDVEEDFRRLQAAGLVINFEKCTFAVPEVDFLGHRVSASAFDAARTALGAAALLAHPQQDQELAVMVDASADHVGAALQQRRSAAADWQPLPFFSKKLEPAQMRYSAFDRELFACVAGIRHFRYMLEGRPFTIYTDHKPLTFALGKVLEPWTAMQSRQLSFVAKFTTDIRHIPGSENIVADTLSRPPPAALSAAATGGPAVAAVAASLVNLDYARIAANQKTCQETLKAANSTSLQLRYMEMQGDISVMFLPVSRGLSSQWQTAETSSGQSTSWHTCHAAVDDSTRGLAWHVFRCVGVVSTVSSVYVARPAHSTLLLSKPYQYRSGVSPTCTWT